LSGELVKPLLMTEFHYRSDEKPGCSVISFDKARELSNKHGTPLLVCSLDRVKENYTMLKGMIPDVDLYYAVKANTLPQILKTLVKQGSKFDVASVNEIKMCLKAGAKPQDLLYANPVKAPEAIKFAYDHNVRYFTYDSLNEVDKMAKHAPGSRVILRMAVRDVGSVCKFSTKFGAREKSATKLIKYAKKKGLEPVGLSFHVGSQCTNIDNYSTAIGLCSKIFARARKQGIELSVLDIGGGIPIEYTTDVYSFDDLAELINTELDQCFEGRPKIIMEPGRPMVGDCMTLVVRVIGTNVRNNTDCAYLNDGVYNSLSERVFGHCEYRVVSDKTGSFRKYILFGPTCDSMDIISKGIYLPELAEGDVLMILNAGAYTNAAATHFNGFDPAKIIFI
jgi:ornithine decarboxylase